MRTARLYIILVFFTGSLFSCEKDLPPSEECPIYIEGWDNIFQSTFITRQYDFRTPVFNPNNPNEFAYIRYPVGAVYNYELRKHNLSTNADVLITNVYYCGFKLSWSQSDWILFNQTPYDVWKIKSDGSTPLIQLTSSSALNPAWKPDGSRFVYWTGGIGVIADNNGNPVDTINTTSNHYSWSYTNNILHTKHYGSATYITKYDVTNDTNLSFTELPIYQDFEWLPNGNQFIGSYNSNLWLVNTQTQERTLIKEKCGDKYSYYGFSVSPLGNKLLVERIESIMVDTFTYIINNDIVLMNIDGSNEQVIELPQ